MFVIVCPWFIIIFNKRHIWVVKILPNAIFVQRLPDLSSNFPFYLRPSTFIMFLVFPSFRISYTWFSFYVVEPHVFCTWTVSQVFLHVTLQVWQPMHLSKFNTIAICALIFKPIYLLHLSHCYIYVTLISYWSIIVKVITNLCVTT